MSSTSPLVSIFSQVNFTLTADNEVGCEIIIRLVIVVAVRNISRIFLLIKCHTGYAHVRRMTMAPPGECKRLQQALPVDTIACIAAERGRSCCTEAVSGC